MGIPAFTDDLLTGHPEVDRQHRLLFDAADQVLALRDANRPALVRTIRFLLAYAHFHFGAEEALMERCQYPRLPHHRRQHDLLRKDIDAARQALLDGEPADRLAARIQILFLDVFLLHVREVDGPMIRHLRQEGHLLDQPMPTAHELVQQGRLAPEPEGFDLPTTLWPAVDPASTNRTP